MHYVRSSGSTAEPPHQGAANVCSFDSKKKEGDKVGAQQSLPVGLRPISRPEGRGKGRGPEKEVEEKMEKKTMAMCQLFAVTAVLCKVGLI